MCHMVSCFDVHSLRILLQDYPFSVMFQIEENLLEHFKDAFLTDS